MVSGIDIEHLKIIRESVRSHIRYAATNYKPGMKVLDIAPQVHAGAREFIPEALTLDLAPGADYQADICQNNSGVIPDGSFDIIICTEVLEHVANPFDAVKELHRLLKPGGFVFVTTPFNFRIHGPLPDNWRFTIHGLGQLFKNWLVTIEEVQSERFLMPVHYRVIAKKKWYGVNSEKN